MKWELCGLVEEESIVSLPRTYTCYQNVGKWEIGYQWHYIVHKHINSTGILGSQSNKASYWMLPCDQSVGVFGAIVSRYTRALVSFRYSWSMMRDSIFVSMGSESLTVYPFFGAAGREGRSAIVVWFFVYQYCSYRQHYGSKRVRKFLVTIILAFATSRLSSLCTTTPPADRLPDFQAHCYL
jgi:hypothetical protein